MWRVRCESLSSCWAGRRSLSTRLPHSRYVHERNAACAGVPHRHLRCKHSVPRNGQPHLHCRRRRALQIVVLQSYFASSCHAICARSHAVFTMSGCLRSGYQGSDACAGRANVHEVVQRRRARSRVPCTNFGVGARDHGVKHVTQGTPAFARSCCDDAHVVRHTAAAMAAFEDSLRLVNHHYHC